MSEKTVSQSALDRVSIRKYTSDPLSKEDILHIVELAGKAPSAWNLQPWRFIAVTNQEVKDKIQAAAYNQGQVGNNAVLFVLTSDMNLALESLDEVLHPELPEANRAGYKASITPVFEAMSPEAKAGWGRGQANIALGYLLLILESHGYGSSPMLGFDPNAVREILGLADHVEIPALISVGRPAEAGYSQHRLQVSSIVSFVD
jgi:nitroreductase